MNGRFITVFFFLVLLLMGSRISFDLPTVLSDIPFTLQSLVVFIAASFLSPKEFLLVIVSYLVLGIVGLPVFAEGSSGWEKLTGNSGGFLIGFVFSGIWISRYFDKNVKISFVSLLNLYVQATLVLFFFGLMQLSFLLDLSRALEFGFVPYWKMSLFKAVLATTIVYFAKSDPKVKA